MSKHGKIILIVAVVAAVALGVAGVMGFGEGTFLFPGDEVGGAGG